MKYHYQYVSATTVRIELIPENKKESNLLNSFLAPNSVQNETLMDYFFKGIQFYSIGARPTLTRFMNFPTVALCSYETVDSENKQVG
jgi:hypothetical protein